MPRPSRLRIMGALPLLFIAACATGGSLPPVPDASSAAPGLPGVRILYEARVDAPGGRRTSFRLAVAVAPPRSLRFEALGPAGGTRLILATDGSRAVAIVVPERRFDEAAATVVALERWTGLPLAPEGLVALLEGHPPCATGCPGLLFHPEGAAPHGGGCSGTLAETDGGRVRAVIACEGGEGDSWPARIRVDLGDSDRSIEMRRVEGPLPAMLAEALFAPVVPAGFRRFDLLGEAGAAPLLDARPGGDR